MVDTTISDCYQKRKIQSFVFHTNKNRKYIVCEAWFKNYIGGTITIPVTTIKLLLYYNCYYYCECEKNRDWSSRKDEPSQVQIYNEIKLFIKMKFIDGNFQTNNKQQFIYPIWCTLFLFSLLFYFILFHFNCLIYIYYGFKMVYDSALHQIIYVTKCKTERIQNENRIYFLSVCVHCTRDCGEFSQ